MSYPRANLEFSTASEIPAAARARLLRLGWKLGRLEVVQA
jgi:hypothetical protein